MKIKAVDYVTYMVSDLKKAINFYQNILGLRMDGAPGETWVEFDVNNVTLVLGSWGGKPVPGKSGIALAVDDVQAALDELKSKGVKTEGEVWETPVCFGGSFYDPDGNTIYLHKRKDGTVGSE